MKNTPKVTAFLNKNHGKSFEGIFEFRVSSHGFLPTKNELTAKFLGRGRVLPLKSELDYRVTTRSGLIGFFDCKNFNSDYFTYSDLDPKQIERAVKHNSWNVPAGFVVWLRKIDTIVFYSGLGIANSGPRTRFNASNGLVLGNSFTLDLRPIMALPVK